MALFLDGIYENGMTANSPSAVRIQFPVRISTGEGKEAVQSSHTMIGLLISEPTLSSANKWGPIISDLSNAQDTASLIGAYHMPTWIGASVQCWKGTDPLKTNIDFMLINYKEGLGLEENLKYLNYLTAIQQEGKLMASTHGGYAPPVLSTNSAQFLSNGDKKSYLKIAQEEKEAGGAFSLLSDNKELGGTMKIWVGQKIVLEGMLLQRLDVTPSIVEVPDGKPLYYKVGMSLVGYKPLLTTFVDNIYNER